jgi:FkbM family methyltransferase
MNVITLLLEKTEGLIRKLKISILKNTDKYFAEVGKWYIDDPRGLKRTTFDFLTSESVAFDLGGYQGEWASDLYARYNCNIYIFEPVEEYISVIKARFKKNEKIKPFGFGLSNETTDAYISIDEFASKISTEGETKNVKKIHLKKFTDFAQVNNLNKIDLIKINIEGAEYLLLEHLFETGYIKNINTILIQFHNFEKEAPQRRQKIQKQLEQSHSKLFDYPFVWECWQLNK